MYAIQKPFLYENHLSKNLDIFSILKTPPSFHLLAQKLLTFLNVKIDTHYKNISSNKLKTMLILNNSFTTSTLNS